MSESKDIKISAATAQVQATTELAEMIPLSLPLRDLLVSKRVCREWWNVHKGSQKIKVALFFRPDLVETLSLKEIRFIRPSGQEKTISRWVTSTTSIPPRHNPILDPFLNTFVYEGGIEDGEDVPLRLMSDSFVKGVDTNKKSSLHPAREWLADFRKESTASWHRMSFTQPALSEFVFHCPQIDDYFKSLGNSTDSVARKGLKVETVYDIMRSHLKYCVNCPRHWKKAGRWQWRGDCDIDVLDLDTTGWEMFEEIKSRAVVEF